MKRFLLVWLLVIFVPVVLAQDCGTRVITVGVGSGTSTPITDTPTFSPPDFTVNWTKLSTTWGTEAYKFGMSENFNTNAQSENIGSGSCLSTDLTQEITGHFYLSKGYKEDPHSGDGAWRRIDSTTTHCDNLKPGQTHTETKNTVISQWITEPGIYNIVYCIDHPRDDHNNGGDHPEEHESNNCSTEAVFEVVADPIVNVPEYNFIVSNIQLASTPVPVPACGLMGAEMWIRNIGNATPPNGIRSSYEVCGPLPGGTCLLIADDGSDASELTPGRDQYEHISALVQAPCTPGQYVLRGTANYQNSVPETDYSDNSAYSAQFEVRAPAPDFIITAVGPAGGSYRIKAGSRFYPAMYIKNIGNAHSPRGIRSAYYYSGPATNYQWAYITDDGTDAGQLCVGCQYREQYDGGMKIGARGTYYLMGCADYQNAVAEWDETNNCSVSAPITIY